MISLERQNRLIEHHTKLRVLNLLIILILLFAFLAIRIFRIQHDNPKQITDIIIHTERSIGRRTERSLSRSVVEGGRRKASFHDSTASLIPKSEFRNPKSEIRYARLFYKEEQFWLKKIGKCAVYINDEELSKKTALRDGDIIHIGSTARRIFGTDITAMWFRTIPEVKKSRIIYRQNRRKRPRVTIGNGSRKCNIAIQDEYVKPLHATLTFESEKYIVTAHTEADVKLPLRNACVQNDNQEFPASEIQNTELLVLGTTVITFPYQKGQQIVEISVLEQQQERMRSPRSPTKAGGSLRMSPSYGRAQLLISRFSEVRRVLVSKNQVVTIRGSKLLKGEARKANWLPLQLTKSQILYSVIAVGFLAFMLIQQKKNIKYFFTWIFLCWVILGGAVLFAGGHKDKLVDAAFLHAVAEAGNQGIIFLDDDNHIQLQKLEKLTSPTDVQTFRAITTKGRDIRKFIAEHNLFLQSEGREGREWFLLDKDNLHILGIKESAVTISNYRRLHGSQRNISRGRIFDREQKSVPKLVVIDGDKRGLVTGSEIWFNLSSQNGDESPYYKQSSSGWRTDIIFPKENESGTIFIIDNVKFLWRKGKIIIDNRLKHPGKMDSDKYPTLYTQTRAENDQSYYPIKQKLRPGFAYFFDSEEGRCLIGAKEVRLNRDNSRIRLGNLLLVDARQCVEIHSDGRFPDAGEFQTHLTIVQKDGVYYARNNQGAREQRAKGQEGKVVRGQGGKRVKLFINGSTLMLQEERVLQPGDFICVGDILMEFIPDGGGLLAGNTDDGRRYYPVNLSHTVGYFAYPDLCGNLEQICDRVLANDNDIILTIDDDLQRIVSEELHAGLQTAGLTAGAVVVLESTSGDILAIASEPNYDPNNRDAIISAFRKDRVSPHESPIINRALHKLYPPGSFFKIVVASAALDNRMRLPALRAFLEQPFSHNAITKSIAMNPASQAPKRVYPIHPMKDFRKKSHHNIDLYSALAQSCNIYFASLALHLGYDSLGTAYYPPKNPLYTHAENVYQFNRRIDLLPVTAPEKEKKRILTLLERRAGDVLNPLSGEMPSNMLFASDLSRVGIGQWDIGVTPLQIAFICSIIANDGVLHTPRLIKQIGDVQFAPSEGERVLSTEIANELKAMMKRVVTPDGTAAYEFKYSRLSDYVAGKTGTPTARYKAVPSSHKRSTKKNSGPRIASENHALFGCVAPIIKQENKPQLALVVFVEYGELANTIAVPIARRILEKASIYYGWD